MALFQSVKALRPKRHFFNLSNEYKFTCDMGQLIPVYLEECYPGDKFKISNECVVRMQPLSAPVMHAINIYTEYFFVPSRLLWDRWSDFFTGGKDGSINGKKPDGTDGEVLPLPLWDDYLLSPPPLLSLWDYFCLPLASPTSQEVCPIALPKYAYNMIWNEYYRDETIDSELDITVNNDILYRRWKKDYFTSALPFQQRGVAPAFPLSGNAPVSSALLLPGLTGSVGSGQNEESPLHGATWQWNDDNDVTGLKFFSGTKTATSQSPYTFNAVGVSGQTADLSGIATFNISDLRLATQIQKWLERNARSGVRYPEFLLAHFGVMPSDSRLQRPEYLGGTKSPLLVSEVLQTSQSTETSPQGNLAGRGIGASSGYITSYSVPEPGYIIGLFSIMPKNAYQSQGINKKWLRRSRYDFYFPEFSHLSEQPIKNVELFLSNNDETNKATFGYQGIYDELRHNRDKVSSYFRTDSNPSLDYWHLARAFSTTPALNSSFLECNPSKRIFEVQDENGFLVDFGNIIKAVRPIPAYAEPGLMDHF